MWFKKDNTKQNDKLYISDVEKSLDNIYIESVKHILNSGKSSTTIINQSNVKHFNDTKIELIKNAKDYIFIFEKKHSDEFWNDKIINIINKKREKLVTVKIISDENFISSPLFKDIISVEDKINDANFSIDYFMIVDGKHVQIRDKNIGAIFVPNHKKFVEESKKLFNKLYETDYSEHPKIKVEKCCPNCGSSNYSRNELQTNGEQKIHFHCFNCNTNIRISIESSCNLDMYTTIQNYLKTFHKKENKYV